MSDSYAFEVQSASNLTCRVTDAPNWILLAIYRESNGTKSYLATVDNSTGVIKDNASQGYVLHVDYQEMVSLNLQFQNVSCLDNGTIYCANIVGTLDDPLDNRQNSARLNVIGKPFDVVSRIFFYKIIIYIDINSNILSIYSTEARF